MRSCVFHGRFTLTIIWKINKTSCFVAKHSSKHLLQLGAICYHLMGTNFNAVRLQIINISHFEMKIIFIWEWENDRHLKRHTDLFLIYDGFIRSFSNDWSDHLFGMIEALFGMISLFYDKPAPSFRKRGDFPLIITKEFFIFFIIEKGRISGWK